MEWYVNYDNESPKISEYIEMRFKHSIAWYDKKAFDNMFRFHLFQVIIIFAGVMVPIVKLIPVSNSHAIFNDSNIKILAAVLGGIIVGTASILQLTKAQESWLIFRRTAGKLEIENQLFSYQTANYSAGNITGPSREGKQIQRNRLFVQTVESIMANENIAYLEKCDEKTAELEITNSKL